jgi:hypothetical protein
VHVRALDAPDQPMPTCESWIIGRERWLPAVSARAAKRPRA